MIYEGSRYEDAKIDRINDHLGVFRPTVILRTTQPYTYDFGFSVHIVTEGQRLDQLADAAYGDPTLWWQIAWANPEILYPEELEPGTILRIPHAPA